MSFSEIFEKKNHNISAFFQCLCVVQCYGILLSDAFLGKLPVPGRPTSLEKSRARAYCTCCRCGWGLFGHFYSHLSFLLSFSLSLGDDPI